MNVLREISPSKILYAFLIALITILGDLYNYIALILLTYVQLHKVSGNFNQALLHNESSMVRKLPSVFHFYSLLRNSKLESVPFHEGMEMSCTNSSPQQ